MKVAVTLGMTDDDEDACRHAGLDVSKADAKLLCDQARERWPDLISGKPAALAALTDRALALMSIELLSTVHIMNPRDLPQALRNTATFKELQFGDSKQVFGNISISVAGVVPDRKELEVLEDTDQGNRK